MVARGHAWLPGGMRSCRGACVVARGTVHGCLGGMRGCWGACMVARGRAWLPGGVCTM